MPELTKYSQFVDVDVEIDVDEFLDACSTHEINEVVEWLQNGDYIKMSHLINDSRMSMGDLEYIKIINKLTDPMVRFRLSEEEMCILQAISDKL
jgi:hypothetical protein